MSSSESITNPFDKKVREADPKPPIQTYILGEVEVLKTGRFAVKAAGTGRLAKSITLFEVTPVDKLHGEWKKWVQDDALFTVAIGD